jgi:hypothetical protein
MKGRLASVIGIRRKKDEQANKDIRIQIQAVLVGFRSAYVFENYLVICGQDCTRSMGPASRRSERTLDSSSCIIAQSFRPAQRLLAIVI